MTRLEEKIIVITGASGTIGRSFAKGLSNEGAIVIATDIKKENIQDDELNNIKYEFLDITSKTTINDLIDKLIKEYGEVHAVVNNAYPRNSNYGALLEDVTYEDFCKNVNMHLGGYFLVSQQFGMQFKKQKKGNIINIASVYGVIPPRFDIYKDTEMTMPVEYAAIKSAIIHLTRYFAQYYKDDGIRVNAISPGGILADQPQPFKEAYNKLCNSKGLLDPSDLLNALIFLLSDDSGYITGQNIIIDDGFTL